MIKIERNLNLTETYFEDINYDSLNFDIHLSSIEKLSNKNTNSTLKIKINDIICVKLNIKNLCFDTIKRLKIKIIDDNNFKYIPCSFVNCASNIAYYCENIDSNYICIDNFKKNDILSVKFYIKAILQNIDNINPDDSLNILPFENTDILNEKDRIYIDIQHPILEIHTDSLNGVIKFKNTSPIAIKDFVYIYSIPTGYVIDASHFSSTLNGNVVNIENKLLDNKILFKLPIIPEKIDNKPSTLSIHFKIYKENSINLSTLTIV